MKTTTTTSDQNEMNKLNNKKTVNYKGEEFKLFNTVIENNLITNILFVSLEGTRNQIEINFKIN